jgi:hypothetical protein
VSRPGATGRVGGRASRPSAWADKRGLVWRRLMWRAA